jgi:hypothetical protein
LDAAENILIPDNEVLNQGYEYLQTRIQKKVLSITILHKIQSQQQTKPK